MNKKERLWPCSKEQSSLTWQSKDLRIVYNFHQILKRRYTESLVCYKEGLQLFLEVVQAITEKEKKAKYRAKASEYLDRSEKVQEIVTREKELGQYQEHYKIEANSEVKPNF